LTLILLALRDYAEAHSDCGVNAAKINDLHLVNQHEVGQDKYKLLLTQSDKDALIKKIDVAPIPDTMKSRVLSNYTYFAGQINKQEIKPSELYAAIGKLQVVDIVLDRQYDDPQAIFESLNSTGMDLKDSDLIRNYLLMGLDPTAQTDIYNSLWRPTEQLFGYEQQSDLLDSFFRDYLTLKLGRIPRKSEVYKEFKGYHSNCGQTIKEICTDIYRLAKHYTNMYFAKSSDAMLKSLYADINTIQLGVAYPFLLKVHGDYDNGIIALEELREIVALCVSYVLRRAVCDIPTNSLNKTFATLKNEIKIHDYLKSVKAAFILMDSYKRFPNNEEFPSAFTTRDIYNMNRCRYILSKLEKHDNKSVVDLDNLTIEHIIPQNPALSVEWQTALGDSWAEIQKKYLHTIGNLTLTAYNPEMSDSPFLSKRDMVGGFRESALRLNKYVVVQDIWAERQEQERAKQLGGIAQKVWVYPTLTDDELKKFKKKDEQSTTPQYTIDSYEQWNEYNKSLFEKLNAHILNLSNFVKREFKKLYIAYKADTNFVDIIPQKSRLRLSVNMKFAEVVDPKGICRDTTEVGRHGNGDVDVFFNDISETDDVMAIIQQAFRLQEVE
jgi:predicted transport protein/uncharacterized protein with ParB-like and HNH nuclease domain